MARKDVASADEAWTGTGSGVDPGEIAASVERVLASRTFARSDRLRGFIRFTVDRTLAGQRDRIKEMTIALEVYGRNLGAYDPKTDPIVRTEARRLRAKLERYYQTEGRGESVILWYPKGGYVPDFRRRDPAAALQSGPDAGEETARGGGLGTVSRRAASGGRAAAPRIAVLPFEDLSAPEDRTSMGLAMAESVVVALVRLGCKEVVSRSSALQMAGTRLPVREIAERLHADYLVTGSVQRVGDHCRVTARLVEPSGDVHLWCEEYEFEWCDVFSVQRDMARHVSRSVVETARPDRAQPRMPTPGLEAYEAAIRANFLLRQYGSSKRPKYFEMAKEQFERALDLEPGYVDALRGYANLLFHALYPPPPNREQLLEQARALLNRALAADPANARSAALLGEILDSLGRRDEGLSHARRAVTLDPSDAVCHGLLAYRYRGRGFHEAALAQMERAFEVDPLWMFAQYGRVEVLLLLDRLDEARKAVDAMNELYPGTSVGTLAQGSILIASGQFRRAFEVLARAGRGAPHETDVSYLEISSGLAAAMAGELRTARRILKKYGQSPPRLSSHLALLSLMGGDPPQAVRRIRNSPHFGNYRWLIEQPAVRPHLARPEFVELLEELYERWKADVKAAVPGAEPPPPELPSPREVLSGLEIPPVGS